MGRGKRQWPVVSKGGGAIWKRITWFGVCLLQGRSSSQWGREEVWKIGCWVSLRFRSLRSA